MQGYQGYGDVVARQGGAPQVDPGGYACFIAAVEDGSAEPNPYIGSRSTPSTRRPTSTWSPTVRS